MAIGDAAAAAGMDLVPGNTPANTIDTEINKSRDYIAGFAAGVRTVAEGGTGASTPGEARANLGAAGRNGLNLPNAVADIPTAPPHALGMYFNDAANRPVVRVDATDFGLAKSSEIDAIAVVASNANAAAGNAVNGFLSAAIYSRTLGTRRSCYVQSDGVLGYDGSSERFKIDIKPYVAPWADIVAGLKVKEYDRIEDGSHEVGLIAEDLDALGMGWAVLYDDENRPEGIAYEKAWLALIPVVQDLMARVGTLEAGDG